MKNPLPVDKLRHQLKRQGVDALLVTQPENRRYLSGYSADDNSIAESAGALLIFRRGAPLLLTDFRFELQARLQAQGYEIIVYKKGLFALLKKVLPARGIKTLALESHYFLHRDVERLRKCGDEAGFSLKPVTGFVEHFRERKEPVEIEKIIKSIELNEKVFQEIFIGLAPGRTEREIAADIEFRMRQYGAEGPSFPSIIASGANAALPHAEPSDRAIREGEPIIMDMGARLDGYCSDMTRTVVLGQIDDKTRELIRLVRKAQLAAIKEIRPGVACRAVDRVARAIINDAGYGQRFGHGLGHGVGLAVHESPRLNGRTRKKLAAGMVVTVEPGIYIPDWGGIRLENMVVVEEDGCRILNRDTTFLDI